MNERRSIYEGQAMRNEKLSCTADPVTQISNVFQADLVRLFRVLVVKIKRM